MKKNIYQFIILSIFLSTNIFCMNEREYQYNKAIIQEKITIIEDMQKILEQESQKLRKTENQEIDFHHFLTLEHIEPIIHGLNTILKIIDDMYTAEQENNEELQTVHSQAFIHMIISDDQSDIYMSEIFPHIEEWLEQAKTIGDIAHNESIKNGDLEIIATYKGLLSILKSFATQEKQFLEEYTNLNSKTVFIPIKISN